MIMLRQLWECWKRIAHTIGVWQSRVLLTVFYYVILAPFGDPKYLDKVYKLIAVERDGSFQLNMDYFCFHHSTDRTYNEHFVELFGPPRDPQAHFFTLASGYPAYFGDQPANYAELAQSNQHYADIAASIQVATEDTLLKMAHHLHRETGLAKLCMAGGVALNSVANGRILRETPFEELYVQPSAGDGGGAMGAALWAYHTVRGQPRQFVLDHAYWGEEYDRGTIETFLNTNNLRYQRIDDDDKLIDQVIGTWRLARWSDGFRGALSGGLVPSAIVAS
jgi:carbamoyltransferase